MCTQSDQSRVMLAGSSTFLFKPQPVRCDAECRAAKSSGCIVRTDPSTVGSRLFSRFCFTSFSSFIAVSKEIWTF